MRFIDQVRVLVRAGNGGDGVVAWRREKFVPKGGPAGGDGGRGGSVVLVADRQVSTLLDLKFRQHYKAKHGQPGSSKRRNGKGGDDLFIKVPVGTVVYAEGVADESNQYPPWLEHIESGGSFAFADEEEGLENIVVIEGGVEPPGPERSDRGSIAARATEIRARRSGSRKREQRPEVERGAQLGDLTDHGQELIVARGGRGGRGNVHFQTSTNRAPDHAESGTAGEAFWLRLELKLLADVGIVGYPNVGKSTLISAISRARPKIGDYPFTTLIPQLGVVSMSGERSFVVADVPGLIDGASAGKGLGHAFLRHLERTRVLLHLLAPDPSEGRSPVADLDALERELQQYGPMFAGRPRVVALNKIDTDAGHELVAETKAALKARGIPVFPISAHTGEGIPRLLEAVWRRVSTALEAESVVEG